MSDYSDDRAGALEDIQEAGRLVTLVKTGVTSFNPLTSALVPADAVTTEVHAVFTAYAAKDIDGEIIKRGDKKCLIAGEVDADAILDGSKRYDIVNAETIDPGDGGPILTKLQVRK